MCARRISRVKPPFGGTGQVSFRRAKLDLKKAQLSVLQSRIQSAPAAPLGSFSHAVAALRRAQSRYCR